MNFMIRFNLKTRLITLITLKKKVININIAAIKEINKAEIIILLIIS